ncbi:MAG: hypothetical protein ACRDOE_26880 [Streptosporangiaceae bacterium]
MSGDGGQSDHIRRCAAVWARAEGQLYPMIMSSPEAFERAVTIARAVADRLRAETTVADLARVFTESGNLALSAAHEIGTDIDDLDAGVLASAGFRLRQQEIAAGAGRAGGSPDADADTDAGEEGRQEQV